MSVKEQISNLYCPEQRSGLVITPVRGDASARHYFRITDPAGGSAVACIDPSFMGHSAADYPFLLVRQLLADNGIRVPGLLGHDNRNGILLLEDCGDQLLQDSVAAMSGDECAACYRTVLDLLVRIQSIPIDRNRNALPFSMSFDVEKLMFEFDFFITHALSGLFRGIMPEAAIPELRAEFESIALLLVQPRHFVLNHRDFHSRNIMPFKGEPVIIDFQDARLGLPQYDAASLLRDSYVRLDDALVDSLKHYHFDCLATRGLTGMNMKEYLYYFDLMAFQRNIKAIGTFSFQAGVAGKRSFEASIAPTVAYLPDYISRRNELATAGKLLEPLFRHILT